MHSARHHAIDLYMGAIGDGEARAALERNIGARYIQHSTGVRDGKDGFLEFFEPFLARYPEREIKVVRALQDGPMVFLHVYQNLGNGAAEWVTMDFFDTDSTGRIVEHWDVIAPYNKHNPSCRSNIDGSTTLTDFDKTDENKRLVEDFIQLCLIEERVDLLADFMDIDDVEQHSPSMGDGADELLKVFDPHNHKLSYQEQVLMVGEGNFVATLNKARWSDEDICLCNLFRLEDGRIVEHWETSEPIPPRDEWVNSGKF